MTMADAILWTLQVSGESRRGSVAGASRGDVPSVSPSGRPTEGGTRARRRVERAPQERAPGRTAEGNGNAACCELVDGLAPGSDVFSSAALASFIDGLSKNGGRDALLEQVAFVSRVNGHLERVSLKDALSDPHHPMTSEQVQAVLRVIGGMRRLQEEDPDGWRSAFSHRTGDKGSRPLQIDIYRSDWPAAGTVIGEYDEASDTVLLREDAFDESTVFHELTHAADHARSQQHAEVPYASCDPSVKLAHRIENCATLDAAIDRYRHQMVARMAQDHRLYHVDSMDVADPGCAVRFQAEWQERLRDGTPAQRNEARCALADFERARQAYQDRYWFARCGAAFSSVPVARYRVSRYTSHGMLTVERSVARVPYLLGDNRELIAWAFQTLEYGDARQRAMIRSDTDLMAILHAWRALHATNGR